MELVADTHGFPGHQVLDIQDTTVLCLAHGIVGRRVMDVEYTQSAGRISVFRVVGHPRNHVTLTRYPGNIYDLKAYSYIQGCEPRFNEVSGFQFVDVIPSLIASLQNIVHAAVMTEYHANNAR